MGFNTRAGNRIGDKGAEALAEALKHNSTLEKLILWSEGRLFRLPLRPLPFTSEEPSLHLLATSALLLACPSRPPYNTSRRGPGLRVTLLIRAAVIMQHTCRQQYWGQRGGGAGGGAEAQLCTQGAGPLG